MLSFSKPGGTSFLPALHLQSGNPSEWVLDPVLCNRIVLQVSEAEESIRRAIISIGALDIKMAPCFVASTVDKELSGRQVFALKKYSKATKELRRSVPLKKYDLRISSQLLYSLFDLRPTTRTTNPRLAKSELLYDLLSQDKWNGEAIKTLKIF